MLSISIMLHAIIIFFLISNLVVSSSETASNVVVIDENDSLSRNLYELYNHAIACHQVRDYTCARSDYELLLSLKPDMANANLNFGVLLEEIYLGGSSSNSVVGNSSSESITIDLIVKYYSNAILYANDDIRIVPGALYNKANLLLSKYRLSHGNVLYFDTEMQYIIDLLTNSYNIKHATQPLVLIATILADIGDHGRSYEVMQIAYALDSNDALLTLNIGNYEFRRNNYVDANKYYKLALQLFNMKSDYINSIMTLNNIGQSYRSRNFFMHSLLAFRTSIHLLSMKDQSQDTTSLIQAYDHDDSHNKTFEAMNFDVNSRKHDYLSVLLEQETNSLLPWVLSNTIAIHGLVSYWDNLELLEHVLEVTFVNHVGLLMLTHHPIDPYTFSLMRYASRSNDITVCMLSCSTIPSPYVKDAKIRQANRTLSIGYISYDYRNHPMGRLTQKLVTSHNISRVNASCISYGSDDGSDVRRYVEANCHTFVDIKTIYNDIEAANVVHSLDVDILVDLTTHTTSGRIQIAALRPTSLTVSYLGYPGSTGSRSFDYLIVDKGIASADIVTTLATESIVYLPYSYQSNFMPLDITPTATQSPVTVDKGSGIRYCSFNANKKMEPVSFTIWMNILRQVPDSLLLLLVDHKETVDNIVMQATFHGVDVNRIQFIPKLDWKLHLRRIANECDLVLDTFVYGAHTTTTDALWMWIPILALTGWYNERIPSKVASSLLMQLKSATATTTSTTSGTTSTINRSVSNHYNDMIDLLVSDDVKEYEELAIYLGRKLSRKVDVIKQVKSAIGHQCLLSPLFDYQYMQYSMELAAQVMWDVKNTAALHRKGDTDAVTMKLHHVVLTQPTDRKYTPQYWLSDSGYSSSIDVCTSVDTRMKKSFPSYNAGDGRSVDCSVYASMVFTSDAKVSSDVVDGINFCLDKQRRDSKADVDDAAKAIIGNLYSSLLVRDGMIICGDSRTTVFSLLARQLLDRMCSMDAFVAAAAARATHTREQEASWSGFVSLNFTGDLGKILSYSRSDRGDYGGDDKCYYLLNDWGVSHPQLFEREGVADILHYNGLCYINREAEVTAIAQLLSSYAIAASDKRLKSLALAIKEVNINSKYQYTYTANTSVSGTMDHVITYDNDNLRELTIDIGARMAEVPLINEQKREYATRSNITGADIIPHSHPHGTVIVVYCNEHGNAYWPGWGPKSIGKGGIGGSEEAVVYASRQLAKLGYHVEVYNEMDHSDFHTSTYGNGSVTWRHFSYYDCDRYDVDVFISWRYPLALHLGYSARRRILWLHDRIKFNFFSLKSFWMKEGLVDYVFVQSKYHCDDFLEGKGEVYHQNIDKLPKIVTIANGVDHDSNSIDAVGEGIEDTIDLRNDNNIFIYGSAPNRGLEIVLKVWKRIKAALPNALLHVYYGFTPHIDAQLMAQMGYDLFIEFKTVVVDLLQQDGITYFGPVDHKQLHEAYRTAGFILYPTMFPETGCITIMKAMYYGAIPITSRLVPSVLETLTEGFDLGPAIPLKAALVNDSRRFSDWILQWADSVVATSNIPNSHLHDHRLLMMQHARSTFNWTASALKMKEYF